RVLEVHGERMVKRTFDPGFRIRLHRKDLSLAIDAAKALNIALPNAAATQQLMNAAIARGDGDRDHSALIQTLEALAAAPGSFRPVHPDFRRRRRAERHCFAQERPMPLDKLPQSPFGAVYFRKSNPPKQDWPRDYGIAAEDGLNVFRHWFMWAAIER